MSPRRNRDNVSTVLRPSVNRSISTRDPRLNCLDYKSKPLDLPVKFNDRTSLRNLNISSLCGCVSFSTILIKFSSTFVIYLKDAKRSDFNGSREKHSKKKKKNYLDEEGSVGEDLRDIDIQGA